LLRELQEHQIDESVQCRMRIVFSQIQSYLLSQSFGRKLFRDNAIAFRSGCL